MEYLRLPEDRYSVEELPDARDYIYSAESLKVLSGKKLGKKKNHINYLKREYAGRYEYSAPVLLRRSGCVAVPG